MGLIPPVSPLTAYHHYKDEIDAAMRRVMESGRYILGPECQQFEQEYAAWLGVKHAVGVASGTEALWLALRAVSIGEGDDVITPSMTASATIAAIVEAGARPAFSELHPRTLTLDPEHLPEALTPRTRAILPVHLYGNPADMTAIMQFAQQHALIVLEDCAQAHGARHKGRMVGTFGTVAAWSFYPTKNLGAFGDGGMVTTDDPQVAERVRLLREYGWAERYHSSLHGWNSRLDELHAAILRVRLKYLEDDNARRREIGRKYRLGLPPELPSVACLLGDLSGEHRFVVQHSNRDALRRKLKELGVGTTVQYPYACHEQQAYAQYSKGAGSLPVTERAARQVFSLPMYAELTDREVERVIEAARRGVASFD